MRIIKGLSLSSHINYDVLHDQIYLAKGNLTKDEVLLRQSQLQTGYSAFFYISLNYTFWIGDQQRGQPALQHGERLLARTNQLDGDRVN